MKQGLLLPIILFAAVATATEEPFANCFQLLQNSRVTFYNEVMAGQGYFVYPPSASADPLSLLGWNQYGLVAGRDFWVQRVEEGILAVVVQIPRAITQRRSVDDVAIAPSFGEGAIAVFTRALTDLKTAREQRDDLYFYRFKAPSTIQSVEFTEQGLIRVTVQVTVQDAKTAQIKIRRDGGSQIGYELDYRFAAMSNQQAGEETLSMAFEINLLEQGFRMGDRAIVRLDKAYEIVVGQTTPLSTGEIIRSARTAIRNE